MTDPKASRPERIAALGYDYAGQPKRAAAACNLCGHGVFVTLAHRDRYGYPAKAKACQACGLTFLDPVMTEGAYGDFYSGVYRPLVSAYHGRRIDAETVREEQVPYAEALIGLLEPFLEGRPYNHLLDVGGSTGVVAHQLTRRWGYDTLVIDPAPPEIEVAESLGLSVETTTVEAYDPGGRRFDVVIVCQTVDHMLDVAGALEKIRGLIGEDGILFLDIVDFRAAFRRQGSVEDAVKIDHPYYLTEETARAYLARAGFAVKAVDYAADHLHIGFVCSPAAADPAAHPSPDDVRWFLREVRAVHNPGPA